MVCDGWGGRQVLFGACLMLRRSMADRKMRKRQHRMTHPTGEGLRQESKG